MINKKRPTKTRCVAKQIHSVKQKLETKMNHNNTQDFDLFQNAFPFALSQIAGDYKH